MSTASKRHIVVVGNGSPQAERVASLLEFIDRPTTVFANLGDLISRAKEACAAEVILVLAQSGLVDVIREFRDLCKDVPPFVLVGADAPTDTGFNQISDVFIGYVRDEIRYPILNALLHRAEVLQTSRRKNSSSSSATIELFRSLVGNSRAIRQVRSMIEQVAGSDATVMITGESGTGKEVVARNIHYHSGRRSNPFVPINCGAIPGDLLESELFGHEKGAFTGALTARQGRFELADGGTIFLDEIGDMPLTMQVKLLRVIQERSFERVGSNRSIKTNVRIIAATHRNLEDLITKGDFREDLYYRLNVFPIEMPRLSDRVEDLPLLIRELVTRLEHEKGASVRLSPNSVMALCDYDWPGNVRELANVVERLSILFPFRQVDVADLPEKIVGKIASRRENEPRRSEPLEDMMSSGPVMQVLNEPRLPREGIDLKKHLMNIEVSLINQALDEAGGVVAHAAKRLSIGRTTLVEKMRKYHINRLDDAS